MHRKKTKWIATVLGASLVFASLPAGGTPVKAQEATPVVPDFLWDFESVTDKTITNALGRTCSTWSDQDCRIDLDDVAVYKHALSDQEVADLAGSYGFEVEVKEPKGSRNATEGIYEDGTVLSQVSDLAVASPDGNMWRVSRVKPRKTGLP